MPRLGLGLRGSDGYRRFALLAAAVLVPVARHTKQRVTSPEVSPDFLRQVRFVDTPVTHPAQRQRIVVPLVARVEGKTAQSEPNARTQCLVTGPDGLPTVHAKHMVKNGVCGAARGGR
jgi:hypothetical protein